MLFYTSTTPTEAANMGVHKKEKSRKEREGKTHDGMGNVKTKGVNFYRYVPGPFFARRHFSY